MMETTALKTETIDPRARFWTLPNIISLYRLGAIPVILAALAGGNRLLFAVLIIANLLSDILDGLLARVLRQETELGARLDSLGDLTTYLLALAGLLVFERGPIARHPLEFSLVVVFFLLAQAISLVRFHRPVCMHLYSSKLTGYVQGFFFGTLFFFGFSAAIFHFTVAVTLLSYAEEIVILCLLTENRTNLRGLYWVLKSLRQGKSQ